MLQAMLRVDLRATGSAGRALCLLVVVLTGSAKRALRLQGALGLLEVLGVLGVLGGRCYAYFDC
jgi:hypothetical protein